MKQNQTKNIVVAALGICLVYIATIMIQIPNGLHGYLNFGDGIILFFSAFTTPLFSFCIGAIGSSMADITSGYASYALFTFFIKGVEGYLSTKIFTKTNKMIISFLISSLWMVLGYFIADSFINQSVWLALLAVPVNIVQAIAGIFISSILHPIINKIHSTQNKED